MRRVIGLLFIVGAATAAHSQTVQPPATLAERAELYQRIAAIESTAELERLARDAAKSTDATQAAQLELILERYFELDGAAAVRLAGELLGSKSPSFVGSLYERLARSNVNDALSALSQIDDLAEARSASMAVLRGLGSDERAFELVEASLQGGAREQFRGDALMLLAATAPQRALDEALALADPEKRRSLAMTVVSRWASDAGSEAIAAADSVADPQLRTTLWTTALRNWRDPDGVLAYVATLAPERRGQALTNASMERLVAADARRTAELAATLPAGVERMQLLSIVGNAYGRQDPDAAVAWARSLDPPQPEIVGNAIRYLATREPLRAFELAGSLDEPQRSQAYLAIVNGQIDAAQLPALANRLLRVDDEQTRTRLVVTLADVWVSRRGDPEGAVAWMSANEAAVPAEAFERVAFNYARTNPSGAAAYVDRVPSRVRAAWIAAVTSGYATTDVQGAAQFLERFRGEPGFDRGAPYLALRMAESDPAAAARLLASVGTRGADGIAPEITIARNWAQRDPAAAAAWALDLPPMQRSITLQMVTGVWGMQDPEAVRRWALGMPSGDRRDQALAAAIRARGAASPDPVLLAAFSEDRARQAAMMNTIMATAQTDTAAARRLIGEHITDPTMRARAEEMVDSFARGLTPLPAGGFGVPASPLGGRPAGLPPGAIGAIPFGVAPGSMIGGAIMIVGPNGQPLPLDPAVAPRPPEPGLRGLPPGVVIGGPVPPIATDGPQAAPAQPATRQ